MDKNFNELIKEIRTFEGESITFEVEGHEIEIFEYYENEQELSYNIRVYGAYDNVDEIIKEIDIPFNKSVIGLSTLASIIKDIQCGNIKGNKIGSIQDIFEVQNICSKCGYNLGTLYNVLDSSNRIEGQIVICNKCEHQEEV